MRALILVAGAALAVSACGSNESAETNLEENVAAENIVTDNLTVDANAVNVVTDANGAVNAVATDMNTNAPDANLANGM